ncbi:hypothetical protein B0T13DRAFT_455787 [Neurospora crassa]|nr:hypothetical protein B0T13DRAFT_455787 [Neurospora crassa]
MLRSRRGIIVALFLFFFSPGSYVVKGFEGVTVWQVCWLAVRFAEFRKYAVVCLCRRGADMEHQLKPAQPLFPPENRNPKDPRWAWIFWISSVKSAIFGSFRHHAPRL